jgi:hypothetical protein
MQPKNKNYRHLASGKQVSSRGIEVEGQGSIRWADNKKGTFGLKTRSPDNKDAGRSLKPSAKKCRHKGALPTTTGH